MTSRRRVGNALHLNGLLVRGSHDTGLLGGYRRPTGVNHGLQRYRPIFEGTAGPGRIHSVLVLRPRQRSAKEVSTTVEAMTFRVLRMLLTFGFVLSLLVVAGGFVIEYRDLSKKQQRASVELLKQDLDENIGVVVELKRNAETILRTTKVVYDALRNPRLKLLSTLFPVENADSEVVVPPSLEYARQQLLSARAQKLLDDPLEQERFHRVGEAIV